MPASPVVGMLACWHAGRWSASEGGGEKCCLCCWDVPQHASTPSCWHAGMLGCKPAAQTDQHDNDRGAGRSSVAVAVGACVYPSTQHPAPCHFGVQPRMLVLWPCTALLSASFCCSLHCSLFFYDRFRIIICSDFLEVCQCFHANLFPPLISMLHAPK